MKHTIVDEVRYDLFRRNLAAVASTSGLGGGRDGKGLVGTASLLTGEAVEELLKAGIIKAEHDYSQEVMDKIDAAEVGGKASDQIKHLNTKEDRNRLEYRGVAPR